LNPSNHDGTGIDRKLHNPIEDRLIPLEPLDLNQVHSIDDLVRAMSKTAFTGRQVGEAADVLEAMARDKDCFVVMTLAGAMTVAKQGLIISELIDRGIVNAIVSTGALMAHGLVEATGKSHFRYNPEVSDTELYEQGYNRVYDTLEPEQNLDDVEEVMSEILEGWEHNEVVCSYKLNHTIGEHLAKRVGQRGILKSAYEKGVPVFVPAFTDSELGLDVALNNRLRESTGRHKLRFDPFEDLEHFAATLLRQTRLGILTIGGGVPRNWSQQFGPFIELRHRRLGENVPLKRYHYGVRICPEPVYWGGLSGSPYSEAISWGKFVPPAEGGKFGEVFVDATVGLPLIVAAVLERLGKDRSGKEKEQTAKEREKTRSAGKSAKKQEKASKKK
jgi:deoxyhypusine synthase